MQNRETARIIPSPFLRGKNNLLSRATRNITILSDASSPENEEKIIYTNTYDSWCVWDRTDGASCRCRRARVRERAMTSENVSWDWVRRKSREERTRAIGISTLVCIYAR